MLPLMELFMVVRERKVNMPRATLPGTASGGIKRHKYPRKTNRMEGTYDEVMWRIKSLSRWSIRVTNA